MTAVHYKLHASRPHSLATCTYINQSRLASYYRSHSVVIRPLLTMSSTSVVTFDVSKLTPAYAELWKKLNPPTEQSHEYYRDLILTLPAEYLKCPPTHTIPAKPETSYDHYTPETMLEYKPTFPGLRVNFNDRAGGDLVAVKVSPTVRSTK